MRNIKVASRIFLIIMILGISNVFIINETGFRLEGVTGASPGNPIVRINTTLGTMKIELFKDKLPTTTENFIKLVEDDFYDGLIFHRIKDDFMIQAGRYMPNGTQKVSPYGTIPLETYPDVQHVDGAISMARATDPNSASAEFFICDEAQHFLDEQYAAFGVVTEGLEVVGDIASVPHDESLEPSPGGGKPLVDIIINSITSEYSENHIFYVGGTGPGNYTTIQSAIDNATGGDTVFVYNGTYYENIVLHTPLTLLGEHTGATIINANGYGDVIMVTSPNCTIKGFTIINSGSTDGGHINCGIHCGYYSPWITHNLLSDNNIGIGCWDSTSPIIEDNSILNNTNGIYAFASFPHIENNTIMGNEDAGITLRTTAAPTIIGNTISHNSKGINCNYVTGALTQIKNNNVSHNQQGIKNDGSLNITIDSNTFLNNSEYGIVFSYSSSNNSIDDNLFSDNSDISIYLSGDCTTNTIANNTILHSHVGIYLSNSQYNILRNNTIQDNQLGIRLFYSSNNNTVKANTLIGNTIGLYLFSNSTGNLILENTITTSTTRGIYTQSLSNNNSFFHNNFIDNTNQALDNSINIWDHNYPTGGNYWSDFDESSEGAFDNNSDGIIDTPYFIPGGSNSDRYPLMIPHNLTLNQRPTCILSAAPTSGTAPLTVTFTMTASDNDGTIATWTLDINNDGTAEYSGQGAPPSTQQHTYQTAGTYTATLTVTDNNEATGTDTVIITALPQGGVNTLYVGGIGPGNYTTIQTAIDDAHDNNTVCIFAGIYYENIVINKSLTLIGENENTTIIDGNGTGDVIYVSADWVNITQLKIQNSGGTFPNAGINIHSNYSTIHHNQIVDNNNIGIHLIDSSNNTISDNNFSHNDAGLSVRYSQDNVIINNTFMSSVWNGFSFTDSSENMFSNNIFFNDGISLSYSSSTISAKKYHNTVSNNTVNGKPLIYLVEESDSVISAEAGQLVLIGCDNITLQNQTVSNTPVGIQLIDTTNSLIKDMDIKENRYGIRVLYSHNNTFLDNTISHNIAGIYVYRGSGNSILENNISHTNGRGVFLHFSTNNTISNNTVYNNNEGITLYSSSDNNRLYHNNMINNTLQAYDECSNTMWDNGYPSGGNYWSDFDEPGEGAYDNYNGPNQDIPGGDGIVDGSSLNPYSIPGGNNQDKYPLIPQWNNTIIPPTCSLYGNPASGTAPLSITFSIEAHDTDGTIVSWSLDINNDGTVDYSGMGSPPSMQQHTYTSPGSYTAKLLVTDNQGATASDTSTISVSQAPPENQPPDASFSFSPVTLVVDETIFFDASSSIDPDGSLVNYEWDFNNDGIYEKTGITTTHMWSSAGEYHVSLRVTDNNGSTDIHTKTVTVVLEINIQPTCSLTVNPTSGTAPLLVTFTLSANDPDGFISTWTLDIDNDGSADYSGSGTPPSTQQHTYQTAGSYTAKLRVIDNDGATNSATKTITVNQAPPENQPPIANFTYSIDGLNVTFTDVSEDPDGNIIAWYWDFGDNNSSTVPNPTHSYQEEGSYTVTVTVTDNNEDTDTYSKIITVTIDDDGNGIPGFEFISLMLSLVSLLFLTRRKKKAQ